jgi:Na+-driven multidrug efflux pump
VRGGSAIARAADDAAGRPDRTLQTARVSATIGLFTLFAAGAAMFLLARPVALFLMPEGGEAIEESSYFIRVMAFSFGFIAFQQMLTGTLR